MAGRRGKNLGQARRRRAQKAKSKKCPHFLCNMVGVQLTFRSRTPALWLMLVTRIWANISDQINEDALDPSFFIESRIIGGSVVSSDPIRLNHLNVVFLLHITITISHDLRSLNIILQQRRQQRTATPTQLLCLRMDDSDVGGPS